MSREYFFDREGQVTHSREVCVAREHPEDVHDEIVGPGDMGPVYEETPQQNLHYVGFNDCGADLYACENCKGRFLFRAVAWGEAVHLEHETPMHCPLCGARNFNGL